MQLVVDASIVFTALTGRGVTKDIIFSNDVELYAPEDLLDEIEEHWPRIKELSGLSEENLVRLFELIKLRTSIVQRNAFDVMLKEAVSLIDKEDAPYIALSLALGKIAVWSNDSDLKRQQSVPVSTTSELVSHLKPESGLS